MDEHRERMGLAVVGLRFGAYILDEDYLCGPAEKYFELKTVCDLNQPLADVCGEKYEVQASYELDDLLDDPSIQVIGLFTRPHGRAELIQRIVRAGKDVMTTKPFELDPEAAADVLEEAARLGRHIYLNSPGPFLSPDLQQVVEWRHQYQLGRPVAAHWETWVSYRETPDDSWYDDPELCPVAPLLRLGIYGMNELAQIFFPERAEAVQVVESRLFTQRPTSDHAVLTIRFSEGSLATVFASFCIDDGLKYPDQLTLHFENGTVFRRDLRAGVVPQEALLELVVANEGKPSTIEQATFSKPLGAAYPWKELYEAIKDEKPASIDYKTHILEGVCLLDAAARASKNGGQATLITNH